MVSGENSDGSGDESDIYIPPCDSPQSRESENRDPDHVQPAKVAKSDRPAKLSARSSIANTQFTNDGVGMPSQPVQTQTLPALTTQTFQVPKHITLKRKKHTIQDDSQGSETATVYVFYSVAP